MISKLFGGGSGRILVLPGKPIPAEAVRRHGARHQPRSGEKQVGETADFAFYTDGTPEGDAAVEAMARNAEADLAAVQEWFGGVSFEGLPFRVYADPDAGGAYHLSCAGTDIHVLPDRDRAPGFLLAEVVEVFEAEIKNGWDCGHTNGEALSRVLAFERYPALAADFVQTEQTWWANGHQDYVTFNGADDVNPYANGCGDLFLYYLHSQLTFGWGDIVRTGGKSLGATYQTLAGYPAAQGFSDFISLLKGIDEKGVLTVPGSGNPFPL